MVYFILSFLMACAPDAVSADLPDREPLTHFCAAMVQGPSPEALKGDALQRQQRFLDEMTTSATANKVPKWKRFVRQLEKLDASERQGWIDSGIAAYNLEKECAVLAVPPSVQ